MVCANKLRSEYIKRKYMGKEAEREVKTLCLIFCILIFLVLTGGRTPQEEQKADYRFISAEGLSTLEESSRWKTDAEWNQQLCASLNKNSDREARWVYIFRQ